MSFYLIKINCVFKFLDVVYSGYALGVADAVFLFVMVPVMVPFHGASTVC
jgi:hypothetical protein